jgi:adenosylhomocysteine nucleosidase
MILVLTPLQIEFDALNAALAKNPPANRLRLAVGGHGKVQFALSTQQLILELHPRLVICAGAAGALSAEVKPLDVVIAEETIEHDYNLRFIKRPQPSFAGDTATLEVLRRHSLWKFGKIASGDEDVLALERAAEIRALTGAVAVAWEGAGCARACVHQRTPFLEVRCITDSADADAPTHFATNVRTGMARIADVLRALAN